MEMKVSLSLYFAAAKEKEAIKVQKGERPE